MAETSILYIEDNPENRLLVRRTLEAAGYIVAEAVDGPSGLKAATESYPDLILLDISLPEIDGYELARKFSDLAHLNDVPVLAMTANVMKGDRERALGAGCDGYIPKPIDIDELPEQIEHALSAARDRAAGLEAVEPGLPATPVPSQEAAEVWEMDVGPDVAPDIDWLKLFEAGAAEELAGPPAQVEAGGGDGSAGEEVLADALPSGEPDQVAPVGDGAAREREAGLDTGPPKEQEALAEAAAPGDDRGEAVGAEAAHRETEPVVAVDETRAVDTAEIQESSWGGVEAAEEVDAARIVLTDGGKAALLDEMEDVANEVGAEVVMLVDRDRILASVGEVKSESSERLIESVAEGIRACKGVASLLQCEAGCYEQITDTGDLLLHLMAVDGDLVLLTAMPTTVPLGAARLWVKRSATRVGGIVREAS